MLSICAYPARPWTCDSSVTMATLPTGLSGILGRAAWALKVRLLAPPGQPCLLLECPCKGRDPSFFQPQSTQQVLNKCLLMDRVLTCAQAQVNRTVLRTDLPFQVWNSLLKRTFWSGQERSDILPSFLLCEQDLTVILNLSPLHHWDLEQGI